MLHAAEFQRGACYLEEAFGDVRYAHNVSFVYQGALACGLYVSDKRSPANQLGWLFADHGGVAYDGAMLVKLDKAQ